MAVALWGLTASQLAGCGSDGSGPGPSPVSKPPQVFGVTPAAGSTAGGTTVTISGANFSNGATVTIAGVAATQVNVQSAASLTAVTGPGTAGTGDVVVQVAGLSGRLTDGFSYAHPGPANNPAPVIAGLTAQSPRPNAPARFADVDEEIAVTANVTDAESATDLLVFEWSADGGTFTGTGPSVEWRAPRPASTPAAVTLTLAVVERYVSPEGVVRENRVERSTQVNVHDSVREVGEMAVSFLTDFSNSSIAPETVVRDFSPKCRGRAFELDDVRDNRAAYVINDFSIGEPAVTVAFDGVCGFRSRSGDACARVPVRWEVTERSTGEPGIAEGTDQVTAIYDAGRWYLCDSDFDGRSVPTTLMHRFKK